MDLLEERSKGELDDKVKKVLGFLKYKKYPLVLKGSSSLKSQRYYGDYDLMTIIPVNQTAEEAYRQFTRILSRALSEDDVYFIELKLQTQDGKKVRFHPKQTFALKQLQNVWSDIDFVKIDFIVRASSRFVELSVIYKFSKDTPTTTEYLQMLRDDIEQLVREKEWYKALKREFSIAKIQNERNKMKRLTAVFNSDLGALYQKISNLEAIQLVLENYDDPLTEKKALLNLQDLKLSIPLTQINATALADRKRLNATAKPLYYSQK
jgi:hypothetical protein